MPSRAAATMAVNRAALEARGVSVSFQGVRALEDVSLELARGAMLGLIGPNGAGKTTLVNVLTGFQKPDRGEVRLEGASTTGWPAHRFGRAGVVRTFQSVRLFGGLTVEENVEAGAVATGLGRSAAQARAGEMLSWLGLTALAARRADSLPFGEERRVGIGRALAMRPGWLLLDEPAAGLNDRECDELGRLIRRVRDELGCGVLLIEHRMALVFGVCEAIQVLEHGRTIAAGPATEIRRDASVRRAYLGEAAA